MGKTPISSREVGQGRRREKAAPSGKEARKEDRVSLNFSPQADRKTAKTPSDCIRMRRQQPGRHGSFEGCPLCVRHASGGEPQLVW